MPLPLLLVGTLVVVPLLELYVLLQVGSLIGAVPTVLLLLLDSLLGAFLLRREGRRTWTAFRGAMARGGVPGREVADGALVLVGGALLVTPGFVTDLVGAAFVLPPTRALVRRRLLAHLAARALGGRGWAGRGAGGRGAGGRGPGRVVDGERGDL